ncbi:hypothetical protein DSBG_0964 [Desulfosporosinus sp. BG]|nr:hypothetical protein DSBG_0964 [Desulfosporosinus sp. BG]
MTVNAKDKQTALELAQEFWNVSEGKLNFSCKAVADGISLARLF